MAATQQGVAQRVLSAIPGNPKLTEVEAICCHAGAEEMLKHLSVEARRLMTEEQGPRTRVAWRQLCDALGLDLEGDES